MDSWCRCRSLSPNKLHSLFHQLQFFFFKDLIYGSTLTFPQRIISVNAMSGAPSKLLRLREVRCELWGKLEQTAVRELSRGFCTVQEAFIYVPHLYRNLSDAKTGSRQQEVANFPIYGANKGLSYFISSRTLIPAPFWTNESRNPTFPLHFGAESLCCSPQPQFCPCQFHLALIKG